ncbi:MULTISPECIES: ABC transporter substrate-binding protein [unclassified Brachybacterium]|uniref:ABC transporter substrate-binding protein n=1 Tax=unclassified Brachybacterium TaxID=2623841 RepID=UPI0036131AB9
MKRRDFTTLAAATTLGAAAVPTLSACGSGGGSGDGTSLVIWHYENEDSAMGQAWARAQEIFEEKHPEVTVTVEKQTFEQLQKNAKIVLTGNDVPDLMEYNKGNSTAGQLASQGLLEPLTEVADENGWGDKLSESLQATSRYDESGLMGSGDWFGLPNYGEYVYVFYNKRMFDEAGVSVPTTLEEFEEVLQTFVDQGTVPLAEAGAEYPAGQLWYQLVLAHGDRSFVDAYQLFDGEVDFAGDPIMAGAQRFADWVEKGYISADSAGLTAEDMGTAFISGTYPIMFSGSWWFGRLVAEMSDDWGQFLFPGTDLTIGSSGNLWVVPTNAANKDLAYEFMEITMTQEVQDLLGQKGGLPVAGDTSTIEDEKTKEMTENFTEVIDADGLAFYPDWPVAGFYDQVVSAMQSLINGSKSPADAMAELGESYSTGRADLTGE